jgi:hypothetical protein
MSRAFVALALSLAACGGGDQEVAEPLAATSAPVRNGTPEGVGLLAFLDDDGTTFELLDGPVGLDRRAAKNLVAHRDGADRARGTADDNPFDSVEEVDEAPQVGPSTLEKLLSYASANGFVPEGNDVLGIYDGVGFTVNEAAATLELANAAEHGRLDDEIGLDRRAADSIVAGRPIPTVLALSELSYVGGSALGKLKEAAGGSVTDDGASVRDALAAGAEGLWHQSESDYSFVAVLVEGAGETSITADDIKDRIASIYVERPDETPLAEREVEVRELSEFFERYTQPWDYWEPEQHEAAPKFLALQHILEERLMDAKVYRLGHRYHSDSYLSPFLSGAIDVYIVGRSHDGHLVGLWTISVET